MIVSIRSLTSVDYPRIKNFLRQDERSLFSATPEYLELLNATIAGDPFYFLCEEEGSLLGCLPAMIRANDKLGTVLNSLPFFGMPGGLVIDQMLPEAKGNRVGKEILTEIKNFCLEHDIISSNIIENPLRGRSDFYSSHLEPDFTARRIGQITHLPGVEGTSDEKIESRLMDLIESVRRRNVRKARKEGVECTSSQGRNDLLFLGELHQRNMEAIEGKKKPLHFFESISEHVPNSMYEVNVARLSGEPIAGLLCFQFNNTVEYYTPAYDIEYKTKQATSLLIFETMKKAVRNNFKFWNWGGTREGQDGVYNFKKRWGTKDFPYKYYINSYSGFDKIKDLQPKQITSQFPHYYLYPFK